MQLVVLTYVNFGEYSAVAKRLKIPTTINGGGNAMVCDKYMPTHLIQLLNNILYGRYTPKC